MTSRKSHNVKHDYMRNKHPHIDRPVVSIAAPSIYLFNKIKETKEVLDSFEIPYSVSIVAAHRAPRKTLRYIDELESSGIEVIIACGSGSAHLPGMIASLTSIPVIGIPLVSDHLGGIDSLLSMLQMPDGVPVATVGIASAYNAGIIACQILSLKYPHLKNMIRSHKSMLEQTVELEDRTTN
jgi:5-(carboxyamino)imidazole ribonucleotide mutase